MSGKKIFEKVGFGKPRYSAFDLSHERKMSFNMGDLTPCYFQEVLPGDQFRVKTESMLRMAPLLAPVMHRVNVYVHYFFVPNRLVWNQWEDFITGGQEGTTRPNIPKAEPSHFQIGPGTLADYLGVPDTSGMAANPNVSVLPFRAYQQIWNDYYRDPNLEQDSKWINESGSAIFQLRKRSWEHDYFTSALPWSQRGPEVKVPFSAEVDQVEYYDGSGLFDETGAIETKGSEPGRMEVDSGGSIDRIKLTGETSTLTVNDLRQSTALQRFLEKNARGGYRYIEQILSHFGVRSSDARLQRPEYLGGGRQPVVISEVLNTAGEAEPTGSMAGHGISTGTTNSFRRRFEEHGYVFGIMSVMPRTAYQQGLPRHFTRSEKEEFYWPDLANLGEQEVLNQEIYWDSDGENEGTFGYQQRYAEYKHAFDTVHGDFRDSLDFWHMGRIFSARPQLNVDFVRSNPTDRIFAVTDSSHKLWCQVYNNVKARRPMPYFANPTIR